MMIAVLARLTVPENGTLKVNEVSKPGVADDGFKVTPGWANRSTNTAPLACKALTCPSARESAFAEPAANAHIKTTLMRIAFRGIGGSLLKQLKLWTTG